MPDQLISDSTIHFLKKSLDVSARRHRVISNNIANQDTIGYQPKDLDFRKTLEQELKKEPGPLNRTHPKHLKHRAASNFDGAVQERTDGQSGVNIDTEMTHLMENNIKYRTSVEMLLRKMNILKNAIIEGGR
jgi:flagellar basal-body rod protein FlgB